MKGKLLKWNNNKTISLWDKTIGNSYSMQAKTRQNMQQSGSQQTGIR